MLSSNVTAVSRPLLVQLQFEKISDGSEKNFKCLCNVMKFEISDSHDAAD